MEVGKKFFYPFQTVSCQMFCFRGGILGKLGELTPAAAEKLFNLKLEMTELEREERLIDSHTKWLKQVKIGKLT